MNFLELPLEIQTRILDLQKMQGNERDETIFIRSISAGEGSGGMDWSKTPEGRSFWWNILSEGDVHDFFRMYPKVGIKKEFRSMYKKQFKVNNLSKHTIDTEKIKKLGLEHILL